MRGLLAGIAVLALAGSAAAGTLKVPNQYPTIQDAADAAQDGDTIVVSKGPYYENVVFNASNLKIVGKRALVDGTVGSLHGTCFTVNGSGTTVQGFRFRNGFNQVVVNGSDCVVQKCVFTGARGTALTTGGASNSTVSKCLVRGAGGGGIVIAGTGLVSKCGVRQCDGDGIRGNGGSIVVEKCVVLQILEGYGILLNASDTQVLKNRVTGCGYGISVSGNDAYLEKNAVARTGQYAPAIRVQGDRATVAGCVLSDFYSGIEVDGDDAQVLGNRVDGPNNENYGIYVAGDNLTISGNDVRNGYYYSIGIYAQSGSPAGGGLVEGNTVTDVEFGGYAINTSNATVQGCRALGCGSVLESAGFFVGGSGNSVENCLAQDCQSTGFLVQGDGHTLTRCTAKDDVAYGFLVQGDGHTLQACVATGHDGAGLVNDGTNLTVAGGVYLGNRQDITISPNGMPTFTGDLSGTNFLTGGTSTISDVYAADSGP